MIQKYRKRSIKLRQKSLDEGKLSLYLRLLIYVMYVNVGHTIHCIIVYLQLRGSVRWILCDIFVITPLIVGLISESASALSNNGDYFGYRLVRVDTQLAYMPYWIYAVNVLEVTLHFVSVLFYHDPLGVFSGRKISRV